jgi:hypothetical protein
MKQKLGVNQVFSWLGGLQGFSKVLVELDCKQPVDDVLENLMIRLILVLFLMFVDQHLVLFSNFMVSFVKRQLNYVVHTQITTSRCFFLSSHQVFEYFQ